MSADCPVPHGAGGLKSDMMQDPLVELSPVPHGAGGLK